MARSEVLDCIISNESPCVFPQGGGRLGTRGTIGSGTAPRPRRSSICPESRLDGKFPWERLAVLVRYGSVRSTTVRDFTSKQLGWPRHDPRGEPNAAIPPDVVRRPPAVGLAALPGPTPFGSPTRQVCWMTRLICNYRPFIVYSAWRSTLFRGPRSSVGGMCMAAGICGSWWESASPRGCGPRIGGWI
jgi:hypothetical protein